MTSPEKFTKVPNRIQDWLMIADLNMTQFRIIHAIIRHTYGYHEQWCWLALTYLSDKIKCDRRQVTRELKSLIARKIVTERYDSGKRLLKINSKTCFAGDSSDTSPSDSLDTSAGDSLDTHIKITSKENVKENIYIVLPNDDVFMNIYNKAFKKRFNKPHMKVSEMQLSDIELRIQEIQYCDIDTDTWKEKVEEHFNNLPESNNGNIIAFLHASFRYFEVGQYS